MNTLTLSPTLYAICERSGKFRTNRYYDRLNVCNVVRSLLFVLIFKTALPVFLVATVLNGILQLGFVMIYGWLNPNDAMDLMVDALKATTFHWHSIESWFRLVSVGVSGMLVLIGYVVVFGVPLLAAGAGLIVGFKKLAKACNRASNRGVKVLGPLEVVGEYIVSKHSKFCRNIDNAVAHKTTYAEELRNQMEASLSKHWHQVHRMSKEELLASIERNRSILAKYA